MDILKRYYDKVNGMLLEILSKERENIEKAARLVAKTVEDDKLFYVFGTGAHSIMVAMESFLRAGGLCNAQGIFPPGLTDYDGTPKTERIVGWAPRIFDWYGLKKGDLLIISNVNGINPMTIDAALVAREKGINTIGITSTQFALNAEHNIPNRHSSNQNLHDLVDLVVDSHVPLGDALLDVPGVPVKVGAGSTYPMVFVINSIVVRAIEILAEKGIEAPVMLSGNIAAGDDYNQKYHDKYASRIKHFE